MSTHKQLEPETVASEDAHMVFLDSVGKSASPRNKTWKILIADDDEEVHVITQMVLRELEFEGRPLELLFAHSGQQTLRKLAEHPDTAVLLLDVVMETEHAGLEV